VEHCEDMILYFAGAQVNHCKTVAGYLYCVGHDFLLAVVLPSFPFKTRGAADFDVSEVDPYAFL